MTKLYISYYEDYISIVEGMYNKKKDKFTIKNKFFISNNDIEIDYDADKYELLRQALMRCQFKSKDVVLCLNTKDVILKSNKIPKVNKSDLEGIMNIEIDEMISLDRDSYVFSYEVTTESKEDQTEFLEMVLAAVPQNEANNIVGVLKEFKLNVEAIDTIATSYLRVLKLVEYEDIMITSIGDYGTIVDIYKNDKLFIHDNIPTKLTKDNSEYQSSIIAGEVNGLMNYYSSRNFGKSVDKIVIIGKYGKNKDLENAFKIAFTSELVSGIENLFDIEESVKGSISKDEISFIVDSLGCMLRVEDKKGYPYINLLPEELKSKQRRKQAIKKAYKIIPATLVVLAIPYLIMDYSISKKHEEINELSDKINQVMIKDEEIKDLNNKISSKEDELKIYDMLLSKQITWGHILNSINSVMPYTVDIAKMDVTYDNSLNKDGEKSSKDNKETDKLQQNSKNTEENKDKTPIYEQIPNVITIEGNASSSRNIGQFVYGLKGLNYFKDIKLQNVKKNEDKDENTYSYLIKAYLKEGVVLNG